MELENHSPFPHSHFMKGTTRGQFFDVIIVAGTFGLEHGQPLYPLSTQKPIVTADRYVDEPETSALLEETHLVVAKQRTDIHLLGHASALDGKPRPQWDIGLALGDVKKTARVTGLRAWGWTPLSGWSLGAPEPTAEVALHSGNAYGGYLSRSLDQRGIEAIDRYDEALVDTFLANPVGLGYTGNATLDRAAFYRAAQIESITEPIRDMKKRYAPVCFGPRARWYEGRIERAGTFDARWQAEHFPYLPPDFDYAYYQSAQPDLISTGKTGASNYLRGDEPLALIGCTESGQLKSELPGLTLLAILTDAHGHRESLGMRLDTVSIDLDTRRVQMVWRLTVPKQWELEHALIAALPKGSNASATASTDSAVQPMPRPVYFHRRDHASSAAPTAPATSTEPTRG